jgi:hypothetical protein
MKPTTLFSGTKGLNTVLDPQRLSQGTRQEPGMIELAVAVNVSVDERGMVSVRQGDIIKQSGEFHSLFRDGGDCFVVKDRESDAALYQVNTDYSLTGLRSGLTKGARMSFAKAGGKTFYSNSIENGFIKDGLSSPWPVQAHVGTETTRSFYPAPVGTHIAHYGARMLVSVEDALYASEPYAFGKFDVARKGFQFGSTIRMVRPVLGGIWVSDDEQTGFITASDKFETMSFAWKANVPAHEWSDCHALADLSKTKYQIPGLCAIWSSNDGICIGTPDGQLLDATVDTIVYPQSSHGATVFDGTTITNILF